MNWREEFNKQFGFYQDKQVVYDFDYEDLQNFISTLIEKILDDIQADRQQLLKAVEEMEAQEKHVVARLAYGKVKELLNEKGEVWAT